MSFFKDTIVTLMGTRISILVKTLYLQRYVLNTILIFLDLESVRESITCTYRSKMEIEIFRANLVTLLKNNINSKK